MTELETLNKELLKKRLLELDIISVKPVERTDGSMGDVYYDIKKAYGEPSVLNMIVDLIHDLFPENTTCVASFGYGGIPLAAAISSKYNLPLTLMREELKKHGLKKWIEGYLPKRNDKVAVVDDLVITGNSLNRFVDVLNSYTPAEIVGCYVVIKESGLETLPNFTYRIDYLFESKDILKGHRALKEYHSI